MTIFVPKSLLKLAELCAGEEGRYSLSGVRVLQLADGRFRLEVTDGKRLAIIHGDSRAPSRGAPEIFAALESVANSGSEVVVPRDDWKRALRLGPKSVDRIGLVMGDNLITVACGTETLTSKPVEGRWPDVGMVLPRTPPLVQFRVCSKI